MKIGYTLWTWLMDEHNNWAPYSPNLKREFEQSLREVSDLGYEVFENFNVLVKIFEDAPAEEFKALVKKYKVEFVNIYHYLTDDFKADLAMAERCLKFDKANGAKLMNIQAPWWPGWPGPSQTKDKDLDDVIKKLDEIGKMSQKYGITLCLHPHYGSTVFTEHEIDYVLERLNSDVVSLCMDTAHTTLAGMNPVKAFGKYFKRIKYVHLKDVDPTPHENPMRAFRALGEGTVDLKGVVNVLKKSGYDGVLCCEADYQRVSNYETAMVSRDYIHRVLGL